MEGIAALLIMAAIALLVAGPVAVIMAIVLFNKLGGINRRLDTLEGKSIPGVDYYRPPAAQPQRATVEQPPRPTPPVEEKMPQEPVVSQASVPEAATPPSPFFTPPKSQQPEPVKPAPSGEIAAAIKEFPAIKAKTAVKGGLELKLGTTVAMIIGAILVIVGTAFFLKHIYETMKFGPVARVSMVAAGGLLAMIIGEVSRRRNFEIVAKGTTALGFALLYAAVFSGSRVYSLFSIEWAFGLSIIVTAGAMAYAVGLDEVLIAFLALLGGYLAPVIITTGQNLPIPLFTYILVLSAGAMGCAMFRRWRVVNWVTMVGTYLLYMIWFEKFYTVEQLPVALFWLGVFGGMYLILPILHGLVNKIAARSEDVMLIVINSIAVFYYLWQMLYDDSQKNLALATAILGAGHIAMVFVVLWRCSSDNKLQAALGVIGSAFVTAAIPMYFNALQPTLIGWSIEAVVLTFIGTRYQALWTKVMATVVSGIAAAGLFYHLPLHTTEDFRLIFNSPFGTWVWVSVAILICHGLWRFIQDADDESILMTQIYYAAGVLLLAVGCALEWYDWCGWHIEYLRQDQAWFLMGMMVLASILVAMFLTRPICPEGSLVRLVGVMVAVIGSVFTAMAMTGVYYDQFTLFLNVPFGLAAVFAATLLYGVWRIKRTSNLSASHRQLPGAMATMTLLLVLVLLSEQIYMYWYCRNEYGQAISDWQMRAFLYMFMSWAFYGLVMLFFGIRFKKPVLTGLAVLTSALAGIGLFTQLPLHSKGDFQFVFNLPFMTWVCVSVSLLLGHGLWRFLPAFNKEFKSVGSQLYYVAGLVLLLFGCALEWYAHCRWQIEARPVGNSNFMLGVIILFGFGVLTLLARPLPPEGLLTRCVGVLTALGGTAWTVLVMNEVYHDGFMIFANVPFAISMLFVAAILLTAIFVRQTDPIEDGQFKLAPSMVLLALVVVWVLLSEQIYWYFSCKNHYVQEIENWRFLARMYMSVSWALYAAVLVVIGFIWRAAGIRYLSLLIFAVLLVKINFDVWKLGSEYYFARIVTFLTTGVILVGVSFLYQYLKNKGFFDAIEIQMSNTEDEK